MIGRLQDSREVIAARAHHAMADGISGVRFLDAVLFDPRAAPAGQPHAGAQPAMLSPLTEVRGLH